MEQVARSVPGFLFIDHFAIAVVPGDMERQVAAYRLLGFDEVHRETVEEQKVREVMLRIGDGPNLIQLLEPTSPDSAIAKQIEKNGGRGGFAHVALRVRSAQEAFEAMQKAGFNLVDKCVRNGSRGTKIFFVHPKSRDDAAFGFLIEVVEHPNADGH
ncbi:MAG TPA: VOC family protein [Bryobacteraceae bacterium]|nr:VOC family protein [Bryobacteraceae bacterium]